MEEKQIIESTEFQSKDSTVNFLIRPWMTTKEAADYLNVCVSTLRKLKDKPNFPWCQPAGKNGKILFPRLALDEWVNKNWQLFQNE